MQTVHCSRNLQYQMPVSLKIASGLCSSMNLLREMWAKYEQLINFFLIPKYDRSVRISHRDSCPLLIIVRGVDMNI